MQKVSTKVNHLVLIVKWIELYISDTIGCDAHWCAPIPGTITLAYPCDLVSLSVIVTDVDCPRPFSSSIIADHTTRDRRAVNKSSVFTSWVHAVVSSSNTNICCNALC